MTNENAHAQVEAFIDILSSRYGMSEQDLDGVVRQLVALNERATRYRSYGEYVAKATISVLVAAFFVGIGWGIVHFVQDIARAAGK